MVGSKAKRQAALHLLVAHEVSERRAAKVLGLHRSTQRYKPHPRDDSKLEERMKELAGIHRRNGLPRIHYLLRREGAVRARSCTQRVYRKNGLQLKVDGGRKCSVFLERRLNRQRRQTRYGHSILFRIERRAVAKLRRFLLLMIVRKKVLGFMSNTRSRRGT